MSIWLLVLGNENANVTVLASFLKIILGGGALMVLYNTTESNKVSLFLSLPL